MGILLYCLRASSNHLSYGRLEYALVLLSLGPLGGDVYLLHRACNGMGTHEDLLSEVLLNRTNQEIFLLKEAYKRTYNKDLVQIVQGELSMKTERCANTACNETQLLLIHLGTKGCSTWPYRGKGTNHRTSITNLSSKTWKLCTELDQARSAPYVSLSLILIWFLTNRYRMKLLFAAF